MIAPRKCNDLNEQNIPQMNGTTNSNSNSNSGHTISYLTALSNIDDEIHMYTSHLRELREKRHKIASALVASVNSTHNNASWQLDRGVTYTYCKTKQYQSLTFDYIEQCIGAIVRNKEHVTQLMNHIRMSRAITVTPVIRRHPLKVEPSTGKKRNDPN